MEQQHGSPGLTKAGPDFDPRVAEIQNHIENDTRSNLEVPSSDSDTLGEVLKNPWVIRGITSGIVFVATFVLFASLKPPMVYKKSEDHLKLGKIDYGRIMTWSAAAAGITFVTTSIIAHVK